MTQLPEHIWNKIMLYNSHPVADIIREYTEIYEKLTPSDLRDNRKQFRSFANYVRYVEDEKVAPRCDDCGEYLGWSTYCIECRHYG